MDVSIGVRGSVVKGKRGAGVSKRLYCLVKVAFIPFLESLGFILCEICAHGKRCFG